MILANPNSSSRVEIGFKALAASKSGFGLALIAVMFLAVGCSVGPRYKQPLITVQPYHNAPEIESSGALPVSSLDNWWTGFNDAELIKIVDRALSQNLDLAASFARVAQARPRPRQPVRTASQIPMLREAIPLTDVLDADRQLLIAKDDLASTRESAARAAVGSFRALGGGWTP